MLGNEGPGEQEEQGLSVHWLGLSVPSHQCFLPSIIPQVRLQLFLQRNWQKDPLACNKQKVAADKHLPFLCLFLILQTYHYGSHKLAIPLFFLVLPFP